MSDELIKKVDALAQMPSEELQCQLPIILEEIRDFGAGRLLKAHPHALAIIINALLAAGAAEVLTVTPAAADALMDGLWHGVEARAADIPALIAALNKVDREIQVNIVASYSPLAGLWPNPGGWMPNAQVVVNTNWAEKNPTEYQAVVKAYNEAAAWAHNNPREAAELLAPTLKMSVEDTMKQLKTEVRYDVSGYNIERQLLRYAAFMHEVGLIKRKPSKLSNFAMPELVRAGH